MRDIPKADASQACDDDQQAREQHEAPCSEAARPHIHHLQLLQVHEVELDGLQSNGHEALCSLQIILRTQQQASETGEVLQAADQRAPLAMVDREAADVKLLQTMQRLKGRCKHPGFTFSQTAAVEA